MPKQTFGHSGTPGFATRAIRAGQDPCSATGATIPPVYQTATFTLETPGVTRLLQEFCDLIELLACHPLVRGAKGTTGPLEDAPEGSPQTP